MHGVACQEIRAHHRVVEGRKGEVANHDVIESDHEQRDLFLAPASGAGQGDHGGLGLSEGESEPAVEHGREVRTSGEHFVLDETRDARMPCQELHHPLDQKLALGALPGVLGGEQVKNRTNAALKDSGVERGLGSEVVVQAGNAQSCRPRDVSQACSRIALLSEDEFGGVEDALGGACTLAQGAGRSVGVGCGQENSKRERSLVSFLRGESSSRNGSARVRG